MKIFLMIALVVYCITTLFIFCYTIMQFHLTLNYIKWNKKRKNINTAPNLITTIDKMVTIQLPLYNEPYVTERLIDAVCVMDYPAHLLEIQVLDDSNDETVAIADKTVAKWLAKGVDIKVVRREDRSGFKAGALKYGLEIAKGEYIAIFDADFIPSPDFLQKTVPVLNQDGIGMVQTRWGHTNREYSLITKAQAFWLENHFRIEQTSRSNLNLFFNFNGTAGVWKKEAIIDAGNWHADTLTEDLDLSYRAQLKGWKFLYLEDVVSPAELPPTLAAFKSQQFRWTKGGAEVSRKMIPTLFKAKQPFGVKLHAIGHLLNSGVYLAIALSAFLSLPLLFIKDILPAVKPIMTVGTIFFTNFIVLAVTYKVATADYFKNKSIFQFAKMFQIYLSITASMSFHNSKAVLQGYFGKKSAFIRTPKFNAESNGVIALQRFSSNKISSALVMYLLLFLLFTTAVIYGISMQNFGFLLFHLTLSLGLGLLFYFELCGLLKKY
ncbi:glycosyltransferase [Ferruginibacter yonginensis]|uniref:Glycosyltransferase n=1 Tax=Ferruginibacter yonginensis TaxID=1310416 RepID=A0ABV8QNJ6_9BACT